MSKKAECPIPGACNQDGAIYEAKVATNDGRVESYVGLAKNFKKRWPKHKKTLKDRDADGQTTLSKYVWKKREEGLCPEVAWHFWRKISLILTLLQKFASSVREKNTKSF